MPAVTFKCPVNRLHVSSWYADDPRGEEDRLQAVPCLACQRVHVIYPTTGKVVGSEEDS
jgi:hypothetical protein